MLRLIGLFHSEVTQLALGSLPQLLEQRQLVLVVLRHLLGISFSQTAALQGERLL